jgi:hypothetical protein
MQQSLSLPRQLGVAAEDLGEISFRRRMAAQRRIPAVRAAQRRIPSSSPSLSGQRRREQVTGPWMPAAARKGQERRSRPRGGGRRREPADWRVAASGVDSTRWVVCILCLLELHMAQASAPLLDLGLVTMHARILAALHMVSTPACLCESSC